MDISSVYWRESPFNDLCQLLLFMYQNKCHSRLWLMFCCISQFQRSLDGETQYICAEIQRLYVSSRIEYNFVNEKSSERGFIMCLVSKGCHWVSKYNVFHPFSYDTVVKYYIDMPEYGDLIKGHCTNFGEYPAHVFISQHSNRASNTHSQEPTKFEGKTSHSIFRIALIYTHASLTHRNASWLHCVEH